MTPREEELEFGRALGATETTAEALHSAQKLFDARVAALQVLYEHGGGNQDQRDAAYDHLEDAGLVPHRYAKGQQYWPVDTLPIVC